MTNAAIPAVRKPLRITQSRRLGRWASLDRLGAVGLLVILVLQLVVLLVLLVLQAVRPIVPHDTLLLGVVPLVVPWAGAVGGVTYGLIALAGHSGLWFNDPNQGRTFNIWYVVRFPVGAVLGTVAAGIVAIFLHTVDVKPNDAGVFTYTPLAKASLALVAFAIGYHQKGFDGLFTRLMTALLGTGTPGAREAVAATDAIDFGLVKVGGSSTRLVTLTNATKNAVTVNAASAKLNGTDSGMFGLVGLPVSIPSGAAGDVQVEFSPAAIQRYSAAVSFDLGSSTTSVVLEGTGT